MPTRPRLRRPTFSQLEIVVIGSLTLVAVASSLWSVINAVAGWF